MKLLFWKWRKYPVRRDEEGRSLRQQAFRLFDKGFRPAQIYKQKMITAKLKTLYRYFEDWKKDRKRLSYQTLRKQMKEIPEFTDDVIKALSEKLKMPIEEVQRRLLIPWGLKQALLGEWPDYGLRQKQKKIEARLMGGLYFMRIGELLGKSPEALAQLLLWIITLKDGTRLNLLKLPKKLSVMKDTDGKSESIELDC